MAQKKAHPAVRFLVAFLIVIAVAVRRFLRRLPPRHAARRRAALFPASALDVPLVRRGARATGGTVTHSSHLATRSILVTGATGYIGGRLVPRLLEPGYRVRCLVRDRRASRAAWLPHVEVVRRRRLDPRRSRRRWPASTSPTTSCTAWRRRAASTSATSWRRGPSPGRRGRRRRSHHLPRRPRRPAADLSEHLRSRQETGDALREAGVPVTEFRAAVIVGSGSVSFEMIRYLTERLPVMVCPQWVYTRVQPIAVATCSTTSSRRWTCRRAPAGSSRSAARTC